ncbi:purple acid phosphatase family protein [Parafrankia discariae]|uniref:purple acid phosphatase family protein n=1 Tax=Parafrankia discariae TaxID=365528 RepID=UPI000380DDFE
MHLAFGPDPATSMVVSWITPAPVARPLVQVITGAAGAVREVEAGSRSYTDAVTGWRIHAHHALLDDLEPDTRYTYEITYETAPETTDGTPDGTPAVGTVRAVGGASFRTAPRGRAAFTFTCFGDHGTDASDDPFGTPASGALVAGVERVDPLFTLVDGDLAYSNVSDAPPRAWADWFAMISTSAARRPWMPSVGNHETERGNGALGLAAYQTYFQLPDNDEEPYLTGLWYAFTVGGVRFVVLSGDDVCYQDAGRVYLRGYSSGRQTAWLERQLAEARADRTVDWIVVALHQAAVSTAEYHNGADLGLREAWLPLFDRYGVDLVISGHEHHYERTYPLRGVVDGTPTLTPRPVPGSVSVAGDASAIGAGGSAGGETEGEAGTGAGAGAGAGIGAGAATLDTSAGTVHMLIGTGGSSTPSAGQLYDPPACRVVVGVRERAPGQRQRASIRVVEAAPWLAARFPEHPYAFAALTVDPGQPGGTTRLQVTVYDSANAVPVPFDGFTLARPRADAI